MNSNDVRATLGRLGVKPNKLKGQNFLIDDNVLDKIIAAAEILPGQKVVEIGPGLGALTSRLLSAGADVLAIEQERIFVDYLRDRYMGGSLDVIYGNAVLKIPELRLPEQYQVVANLPYAITSPTINEFLTQLSKPPQRMVLLIQYEVAERLLAPPGDANRGILTVVVEAMGKVSLVTRVPQSAFSPAPKVESAVIRFDLKPLPERVEPSSFMPVVKAGFSKKRAKIANSLSIALKLPKDKIVQACMQTGIDSNYRAEDLRINDWQKLHKKIIGLLAEK